MAEKVFDFKERTFYYAVNCAFLIKELEQNIINNAYCRQLIRSSSSVGANYSAAKRAKSTADYINKLKIVEEEIDECIYFLELLKVFNQNKSKQFEKLIIEGNEILKICVSLFTKARKNK